jgi:flagellar basal-body rod protein FlgC
MKVICVILMGCLPFQVFADALQDCQELKSEQIRLALTASNLANLYTTRTPEGGPYHPFIIKSCSGGACDAMRDDSAGLMRYLPNHPDADSNGYVAYPNIDQKKEYAAFNNAAIKLKLLANANACGAKIMNDNGMSFFVIQYDGSGESNVMEDAFNLNDHYQVVSWLRKSTTGPNFAQNFWPNGRPAPVITLIDGEPPNLSNTIGIKDE